MSTANIVVSLQEPAIGTIAPALYGHFAEHLGACVDEGVWVGTDSSIPNINGIHKGIVDALKRISPPVLRWPGGCFADDYHWRDGIGPRASRPRRVNIWWGQAIETNEFGTHEFLELCRLIGAEPYLAGNLGSGTVQEMRDWVEYLNFAGDSTLARERAANGQPEPFGVKWWGVGNENWGCGGNFCPEDYAVEYKRFSTYLRDFSGTKMELVACGPNNNDVDWTRRFFTKLGGYRRISAFAAHYYTWNQGQEKVYGTATEYTEDQWYGLLVKSLGMEPLIKQQRAILDGFDPERKIGLIVDEWGTWHPATPGRDPGHLWQQNTLRDALVAGLTLDIFNRHADKVVMANIAQTVNVLQAMILTDGDKMLLTPTYHVFDLYQSHQGGQSLRTHFDAPESSPKLPGLSGSASIKDGVLTLSVVNTSATEPAEATIDLRGGATVVEATVSVLTDASIHALNTFDAPEALTPTTTTLASPDLSRHTFPAASVTVIRARLQNA